MYSMWRGREKRKGKPYSALLHIINKVKILYTRIGSNLSLRGGYIDSL